MNIGSATLNPGDVTISTVTANIQASNGDPITATGGRLDVNATIDTTGLATSAGQTTGNGYLATIAGAVSATHMQVDVLSAPTTAVTGTFWQATQPVSGTVAVTQSGTWDEVGINDSGNSITVDQGTASNLKSEIWGGAKGTTIALTNTVSTAGNDHNALDVVLRDTTGVDLDYRQENENWNAADHGILVFGRDTESNPNKYRAMTLDAGGHLQTDILTLPAVTATNLDIRDLASASDSVTAVLSAETTKVIGTVRVASGGIASGAIASGAIASGAVASGAIASGAFAAGAISDGADVTLGAKADAKSTATDTTAVTAMQVLKEISYMEQNPASRAVTNAGTFATQSSLTPLTTGGLSVGNFTSGDSFTALTNSAQVIKASAGLFYGYYIYNPNTAATYVEVYNVAAASVTVGTTNPLLVFCIPASSGANLALPYGLTFDTAMSIAATTTGGGNTAPSTALEAMVFFK